MKTKIAFAALTVLLVDVVLANRRATKAVKQLGDVAVHLGQILDQNGIEMSEFDEIVIHSLVD